MDTRRILLVDDSSTVLTFERLMLRDEGFELHTARDGSEALAAVQREHFDLVLLDIVMPNINGLECCRQLKHDEQTRAVPVIIVTTKGDQGMVADAYKAGCDDFITKPIDRLELLEKVRKFVGRVDTE